VANKQRRDCLHLGTKTEGNLEAKFRSFYQVCVTPGLAS
jgi:hypothetical protein